MVKQGCQCSAYKIIYQVGRNLNYFPFSPFSWTSSTTPIINIILMFTSHVIANLVQLLLTNSQLNTPISTLTLALIWPQNSKQKTNFGFNVRFLGSPHSHCHKAIKLCRLKPHRPVLTII